jgi:hypothetical protein
MARLPEQLICSIQTDLVTHAESVYICDYGQQVPLDALSVVALPPTQLKDEVT